MRTLQGNYASMSDTVGFQTFGGRAGQVFLLDDGAGELFLFEG